jgi:hypothetical protein
MKKETNLTLGISDPEIVDAYMKKLNHPLAKLAAQLRSYILGVDKSIGEGIYWNAPTFYYTGKMKPFDPKTYKRYIVGFNFYKQDEIRLIFLRGAEATDPNKLLTGKFIDKRKMISYKDIAQINETRQDLTGIIKDLIQNIDN